MKFKIEEIYARGGNKQVVVNSRFCEKEVFGFQLDDDDQYIERKLKEIFKERKEKKQTKSKLKNKEIKI